MKIDKIIDCFKGESDIILICSQKLKTELDNELKAINKKNKSNGSYGVFKEDCSIKTGFTTIFMKGVVLHYTSDFEL